jgi:hypothetical protein
MAYSIMAIRYSSLRLTVVDRNTLTEILRLCSRRSSCQHLGARGSES